MHGIGRGNVNGIDISAVEECSGIIKDFVRADAGFETCRTLHRARTHRSHTHVAACLNVGCKGIGNRARSPYTPTKIFAVALLTRHGFTANPFAIPLSFVCCISHDIRDYDRLCLPFPSSCDQGKNMGGIVVAVARDAEHRFSKQLVSEISIVAGQGVEGDAHKGVTVKHRSRVKVDPTQPNLRQVHLIQAELFDELTEKGFDIAPAQLGENITTRGIDLLALPKSAILKIGSDVVLEITGLRNPCSQIENFGKGLLGAVLDRTEDGQLVRKAGVMSIVLTGGNVQAGDNIEIELPPLPHEKLERV